MKKTFALLKICSLAILLTSTVWANIKESNNISDLLTYATPNSLVLVDLDNTIIQPKQTLGSDQWYSDMVKTFKKTMSDDAAKKRAIAIWQRVQSKIEVVPVEDDTIDVIKKLQSDNIRVMALTARSRPVADRTIALLTSIGIDFSIKNNEFKKIKLYDKHNVKIKNGVIFIGPLNNKGKVLLRFLDKTQLKPDKIIFIDDKSEHASSVDAALQSRGIEHISIRYGAADKAVARFSKNIANKQLEIFNACGKFVSDEFAAGNFKTKINCNNLK